MLSKTDIHQVFVSIETLSLKYMHGKEEENAQDRAEH